MWPGKQQRKQSFFFPLLFPPCNSSWLQVFLTSGTKSLIYFHPFFLFQYVHLKLYTSLYPQFYPYFKPHLFLMRVPEVDIFVSFSQMRNQRASNIILKVVMVSAKVQTQSPAHGSDTEDAVWVHPTQPAACSE